MIINRDFEIEFDANKYIAHHGDSFKRLLEKPNIQAQFEMILDQDSKFCKPVACYDMFAIERFLHDKIELADGTRIGGGPVVNVVAGADELVVAVCSVGPLVDERIKFYSSQKERFKMMILDELATWAVDQIRLQLHESLTCNYNLKGWRTSTCLSPGESAWSVEEQVKIFKLLDTQQIGVALNQACVMYPLKSLSMIFGAGVRPLGVEGLSNCDFCSLKDRCQYRNMRE